MRLISVFSIHVLLAYTPSLVSSSQFGLVPIRGSHFSNLLDSLEPQIESFGPCKLNREVFGMKGSDCESRGLRFQPHTCSETSQGEEAFYFCLVKCFLLYFNTKYPPPHPPQTASFLIF